MDESTVVSNLFPPMAPHITQLGLWLGVLVTISFIYIYSNASSSRHVDDKRIHSDSYLPRPPLWPIQGIQQSPQAARVLASIHNPNGFFGGLRLRGFESYNPSILSLPVGAKYDFVVALNGGRREDVSGIGIQYTPKEIYGMLGDFQHIWDQRWNPRQLSFISDEDRLRLDTLIQLGDPFVFQNCGVDEPGLSFRYSPGPDSPRLFWSDLGEPLLLYHSNPPDWGMNYCRIPYLVDMRAVYPELKNVLDAISHDPPIRFSESVMLFHGGQDIVEKGWSLMTDMLTGEAYFHRNLIPQTISHFNVTTQTIGPPFRAAANRKENCLLRKLDWTRSYQDDEFSVHQAGPVMRFTLCNRGECKPNIHNTVHVSLIHRLFTTNGKFFERRVITFNTTYPFNYISVSKPTFYHGVLETQIVHTCSMSVLARSLRSRQDRRPAHAAKPVPLYLANGPHFGLTSLTPDGTSDFELSHAFLDDEIVIAFGLDDKDGGWIDTLASDIIADQIMC